MACVNDGSRLSFSARSSGRYLSSFSISRSQFRCNRFGEAQKKTQQLLRKKNRYSSYVITEWCVSAVQTALCMWLVVRFCDGLLRLLSRLRGSPTRRKAPLGTAGWLELREQKRWETEERRSDSSRRKWAQHKDAALTPPTACRVDARRPQER